MDEYEGPHHHRTELDFTEILESTRELPTIASTKTRINDKEIDSILWMITQTQ